MKSHNISRKQFGFFDLGLSLLVLALAGSSVYLIESNHPEASTAQPPAAEVSTQVLSGTHTLDTGSTERSGLSSNT
jgi:hypothetical protein